MNKNQLKIIEILHKNGIWKQDMVAVMCGLKPIIKYGLDSDLYFLLKLHLKKLGLKSLICKEKTLNKPVVLIGREMSLLKELYGCYKKIINPPKGSFEIGLKLGYPKCCVQNLIYDMRHRPFPIQTLEATSKKEKLNWRLNYLYNFDSRIRLNPMIERLSSRNYTGWNKYLIPHIPCSFECGWSIEYADKLFLLLSKYFPLYAKQLEYLLNKPVLFINDFKFIIFDGQANGNKMSYKKAFTLNNLTDKQLTRDIQSGNNAEISKESIIVRKGSKIIAEHEIKAKILNFN